MIDTTRQDAASNNGHRRSRGAPRSLADARRTRCTTPATISSAKIKHSMIVER